MESSPPPPMLGLPNGEPLGVPRLDGLDGEPVKPGALGLDGEPVKAGALFELNGLLASGP
jgi:hypothetical protein